MKNTRKGQELALSTIVIAVLVLLVLLVLGIILTKQTGTFSKGLEECSSHGGSCVASETECTILMTQYTCPTKQGVQGTAPICCIKK